MAIITLAATSVLVLIYSPMSQYFPGFAFEERASEEQCLVEAPTRIGEELKATGQFAWEREMMGPIPKVIVAICARGVAPRS